MLKSDLIFKCNSKGQEYIELKDTVMKNHQGSDTSPLYSGLILSTGTVNCPVETFKLYLKKLHPLNPNLWQHPCETFLDEEDI